MKFFFPFLNAKTVITDIFFRMIILISISCYVELLDLDACWIGYYAYIYICMLTAPISPVPCPTDSNKPLLLLGGVQRNLKGGRRILLKWGCPPPLCRPMSGKDYGTFMFNKAFILILDIKVLEHVDVNYTIVTHGSKLGRTEGKCRL